MTPEPTEHQSELRDALSDLGVTAVDGTVDWAALRRKVGSGAAAELTRRRRRGWVRYGVLSGALAASVALLVLASRPSQPAAPVARVGVVAELPIDQLLDSNLSDDQFRALLSGATDANDLLLIAARQNEP